ncbi:hypothetical protein ATO8_16600 [Roseivivax marinus]|uniref:Uncharacterized protein n=1 Tax=Roseivivax marinus TaxID=1379903 RepID=W4HGM9_9RHOB|nr:hypothetical protein [Roseivivax marinus]ETW11553.1 hypothetical protein ATO8_16600 [Roseivivax marinus]
MDWFTEHSTLIQTVTSIATAFIWLFYLQMLFSGLLRQRRPTLSINRGAGDGMDAKIILSNLGYEPIYVQDVLVTMDIEGDGESTHYVTDRRELPEEERTKGLRGTTQGPMKSGDYASLGTVRGILQRAAPDYDVDKLPGLNRVTFTVLGTGQKAAGARKSYRIVSDDHSIKHLSAEALDTEILSPRQSRHVHEQQGPDV